MKKIFMALMLAGGLLTSCDMNNEPDGTITLGEGIQSMSDVRAERNGLYSYLRSRSGGSYTTVSDLQTDLFIGTMQNGNSYLAFTTGNILSNDGDIEGIWAALYSGIMQVNYYIENVGAYGENADLSATDREAFDRYMAEAYFCRGYYNYLLMYYFCESYDASAASAAATGIPLCLKYQPTSDRGTYPGRSTLAETYAQIEEDLTKACTGLQAFEATNMSALVPGGGGYLNSYAVKALQARVALLKKDYSRAQALATEIIQSGLFPLTQAADYADMWLNDSGDELIFQPYGSSDQNGSVPAFGSIFNQVSPTQVKFAPSAALIQSYATTDVRRATFIRNLNISYSGATIRTPSFNKFPGNPVFDSGNTSALKNLPKPFRTSEQYLILAEAANALGQDDVANEALNTLRAARITNYQEQTYNGNVLRDQIRQERVKELVGEGFRLGDLRRWDLGFTRDAGYSTSTYPAMGSFIIASATQCVYTSGDYRYVWPIPSAEMNTNPQLKGQQNKGYN
ncbi:MAG: RagB/SusD family nutrient uptake outer membrane protein [Muribaculaceae bacterium]|nr:RagB/SusD family nutrient uptake outer membrane protein [Muribaculaceae bacterium]